MTHEIKCQCPECSAWFSYKHPSGRCNDCALPLDYHAGAEWCGGSSKHRGRVVGAS